MSKFIKGGNLTSPESKNRLKQHRRARKSAQRKKQLEKLKKWLILTLAVLTLLSVFIFMIRAMFISNVKSNNTVIVEQYLSDNPLQKFKPFFNESEFKQHVTTSTLYKDVQVDYSLISQDFTVNFIEREPFINIKTDKNNYIVSKDGFVIEQAKDNNLLNFIDKTLVEYTIGERAFNSSTIDTITEVDKLLDFKSFTYYKDSAQFLSFKVGEIDIIFSLLRPVDGQISQLNKFKKEFSASEYIDLRVESKVYYK